MRSQGRVSPEQVLGCLHILGLDSLNGHPNGASGFQRGITPALGAHTFVPVVEHLSFLSACVASTVMPVMHIITNPSAYLALAPLPTMALVSNRPADRALAVLPRMPLVPGLAAGLAPAAVPIMATWPYGSARTAFLTVFGPVVTCGTSLAAASALAAVPLMEADQTF